MVEVYTAQFITSLSAAISSTARPVSIHVANTNVLFGASGATFSVIIYNAGTDANPVNAEAFQVTAGGGTLTWTAVTEAEWTPSTHASGSTVVATVLTPRALSQPLADHVDPNVIPDPHSIYVRKGTVSAKGDLIAGTGSAAITRQAVGTDGQFLQADSSQTSGLRWGAVPSLTSLFTHMGDLLTAGALGVAQRMGIGTPGQVLTSVQNTALVATPGSGPTCSAGSSGGSLTNGTNYDFAFAWQTTDASPDGGITARSPITQFVATSTGRVSVQAPAAPTAGLTLVVYAAAHNATLAVQVTLPNAATGGTNTVTVSSIAAGDPVSTVNTTGGITTAWAANAAMTNPMTTLWDLIVGGASGAAARFGIGTVGQILSVGAGPALTWARALDVMTSPGDLVRGGVAGLATRLGMGSVTQLLTVTPNSVVISNPVAAPTVAAGPNGGTIANGSVMDFAYAWSNGSEPTAGRTAISPITTFTITSAQTANVTCPAAPAAGLTLYVYTHATGGTTGGTLYQSTYLISNASTSTTNVVTVIDRPLNTQPLPSPVNTTGGIAVGWANSTALQNPMTTSGDLITGGPSGLPGRRGIGTTGQILSVSAGVPAWTRALDVMTTLGDIMIGGASGVAARLGVGTTGQILTVISGSPAWSRAVDVMTTVGDLVIGSTSGLPTRLGIGSASQILSVVSGAPAWTRAVDVMTAVGDLVTGGTSGLPTRLAPGTTGTYLQANGAGAALTWTVPAGSGGGASTGTSGTPYHEEFAPSAAATTVTLTTVPTVILSVFRNGVAQSVVDNNYTASGSVITFTTAFLAGERVVVAYIGPLALLTATSNLISETVLSGVQANVVIASIPQGYRDLRIIWQARGDTAATSVTLRARLNNDSTTVYDSQIQQGNNTTSTALASAAGSSFMIGEISAASAPANAFGSGHIVIPNYGDVARRKNFNGQYGYNVSDGAAGSESSAHAAGQWRNATTAAVTSVTLFPVSGNFAAGTVIRVYGEPSAAGGASVGTGTRVRIGTNQSIPSATPTLIAWDTTDSDADNQHYPSATTLTGTVAKTATSNAIVGTSTLFTTELSVGQVISVPGTANEVAVVIAIADNTHLTTATQFANSATGQTANMVNTAIVFRQPGFYALELGIYSAAISTDVATLAIRLNGTTVISQEDAPAINASAGYSLTAQRSFQQWDYVEVLWTQNSGGSVNVLADERTHWSISARPTMVVAIPYINVQDQKAQNTPGGTFTFGAWRTRDLNAIQSDSAGIATVSGNQITLPPGRYRTRIEAPGHNCGRHKARLQDLTGAATLLNGRSAWTSPSSGDSQTDAVVEGVFTLSIRSVLEVQHQSSNTVATNGYGVESNFSIEVYTVAEFWKEG